MKTKLFFFVSVVLLVSCRGAHDATGEAVGEVCRTEYATCFEITHGDGYTLAEVRDPWDTTRTLHRYVLVDRSAPLPEALPDGTLVRTPLERVAVYSSVHCGMLDELRLGDRVAAVCESRYIDLPFVREGLSRGTIVDLGEASSPDVERLIEVGPEAVIVSPLENSGYGRVEKTGIPIIECVDYMEDSPLGRTEWVRFMALFFGRESLADSLFGATVSAYDSLCRLVSETTERPTVLTERKYGASWYVPGGRSYTARLLRDAGADPIWNENADRGSVPLPFEAVFDRARSARFWLIKYNAPQPMTYDALRSEYEAYGRFSAFENRHIFVCNTAEVPYYEELPLHPDRVLGDLIRIFHSDLLPDRRLRYYNRMER